MSNPWEEVAEDGIEWRSAVEIVDKGFRSIHREVGDAAAVVVHAEDGPVNSRMILSSPSSGIGVEIEFRPVDDRLEVSTEIFTVKPKILHYHRRDFCLPYTICVEHKATSLLQDLQDRTGLIAEALRGPA